MRIYLRPITLEDGAMIVKWRNSVDVSRHCFDKTYIETGKYRQFIVERIDEDFGVSSYPIATVYFKDFDKINHRCELCIFTSNDQEWNTESQSIAIKLLLKKAFSEYGIHKVYTYVFAENTDEIALMKRAGLIEEAFLKSEAVNCKGDYVDIVRMTITAEEYAKKVK